jgi:tellurite resistance protein TerC
LKYQHRVLFWGITGAMVMRGIMIGAGAVLITRFSWMTYVFGALLLFTAARMMVSRPDSVDPERNILVRIARRVYPLTDGLREQRFFVKEGGRRMMTPLLLVLLLVEGTDLLFAVDSIPAIFAVTSDPFLVYSSNVFAILGLRSLYFALAPLLAWFRFLKASLVLVLAFVGVKMLLAHHLHVPITLSLSIIGAFLGVGILASVVYPTPDPDGLRSPVDKEMKRLLRAGRGFARKCLALVGGSALVLLGGILLVFPPLGLKTIVLGLGVLATHFVWARRLMRMMNGGRG